MKLGRLTTKNAIFFCCDIQGVFKSLTYNMARVDQTASYVARAASILDMPTLVTEHNKARFGPILDSIQKDISPEHSFWFEKTKFSMYTDEIKSFLESESKFDIKSRKNVILYGIEAHVCIQQTSLDLLENGYNVHLLLDGTSSQRAHDRAVAIERLKQSGVFLTTSESVLFELMHDSKTEKLKQLLPLLKEKKASEFERL